MFAANNWTWLGPILGASIAGAVATIAKWASERHRDKATAASLISSAAVAVIEELRIDGKDLRDEVIELRRLQRDCEEENGKLRRTQDEQARTIAHLQDVIRRAGLNGDDR